LLGLLSIILLLGILLAGVLTGLVGVGLLVMPLILLIFVLLLRRRGSCIVVFVVSAVILLTTVRLVLPLILRRMILPVLIALALAGLTLTRVLLLMITVSLVTASHIPLLVMRGMTLPISMRVLLGLGSPLAQCYYLFHIGILIVFLNHSGKSILIELDFQRSAGVQIIIHVELLVGLFCRFLVCVGHLSLRQLAGRSIKVCRAFDEGFDHFAVFTADLLQFVLGHMVREFFEKEDVLTCHGTCSLAHRDLRLGSIRRHVNLLFVGVSFEPLDSQSVHVEHFTVKTGNCVGCV
jgi:hypothetical protein